MEEYPRNVMDLEQQFSTEEACKAYLFRLRWPDGFFVRDAKPVEIGRRLVIVWCVANVSIKRRSPLERFFTTRTSR